MKDNRRLKFLILVISLLLVLYFVIGHGGHDHDHDHDHAHDHDSHTHSHDSHQHHNEKEENTNNIHSYLSKSSWVNALSASFFVSLLSFSGALLLVSTMSSSLSFFLTSLAIGSLLGDTFLHLLPVIYGTHSHSHDSHEHAHDSHSHDHAHSFDYGIIILLGFLVCFFLEMFIRIRQKNTDTKDKHHSHSHSHIKAFGWLNLFGDGIHNFMDGMGLAGAFMVSPRLGLATTLCICFHELPQELSDFGVLLSAGFSVKRALFFNFLSGIVAVLGCLTGLTFSQKSGNGNNWLASIMNERALVAITAGSFLYIISSMTSELWSQLFEHSETPVEQAPATKKKKKQAEEKQTEAKQKSPTTNNSVGTSVVGVLSGLLIMYGIGHVEHTIFSWF